MYFTQGGSTISGMELLKDLFEWAVAVIEHWHGWLSGGILAFSLEISDRLWEWKPNKRLFLVILVVGFFVSIFSAWRDQYRKTKELEAEVANKKPDLRGRIDHLAAAPHGNGADVLIQAFGELENGGGGPSLAKDWTMKLRFPDSIVVTGAVVVPMPRDAKIVVYKQRDGELSVLGNDYWPRSTIEKAIENGGGRSGFVFGVFSGITQKEVVEKLPTVIVSFVDINGKKTELEKPFFGGSKKPNIAVIEH